MSCPIMYYVIKGRLEYCRISKQGKSMLMNKTIRQPLFIARNDQSLFVILMLP